MARRIAVRGIIHDNGKLLAQKFRTIDGGETDYWGTPGGGLDPNESLHDGLQREMIEETGIVPKIGRLLFIQQFHHEKNEQLEFFFHIENPEDYKTVDLSATTHGMEELTCCEFIDPTKHNVLPAFLQTISIETYLASEQPVLVYNELGS